MNDTGLDAVISRKMRQDAVSEPAITGFLQAVHKVQAGDTGLIPESTIEPGNLTAQA